MTGKATGGCIDVCFVRIKNYIEFPSFPTCPPLHFLPLYCIETYCHCKYGVIPKNWHTNHKSVSSVNLYEQM